MPDDDTSKPDCYNPALRDTRDYIPITDEIRATLRGEAERTGLGAAALLRGKRPSEINGMNSGTVQAWMSGAVKTARRDNLDYIIARWQSMPDKEDVWAPLTEEVRMNIRTEIVRTGMGTKRILHDRDDVPQGLKESTLTSAVYGKVKKIRRHYIEYALHLWAETPDAVIAPIPRESEKLILRRIVLTVDMRSALLAERERSGVMEKALVNWLEASPVTDFHPPSSSVINGWMTGHAKTARKDHFDMVLAVWRALPDAVS